MTLPASTLIAALRQGMLLPPERIEEAARLTATHPTAAALASALVARGVLTAYQGAELAAGRGASLAVASYVLLDKLGEGGMGEVFRARHKGLGRQVALKRILAKRLDSSARAARAVKRFQREVEAASKLSHPNVVHVFDAGESGDGGYYLAMELLRGVDLSRYLDRRGPLPVAEAVEYVRQACVGMQHAHEQGLVHRDLKPANLWLTQKRQVKILDLGLALITEASTMTQVDGTFGTVDYVAPEQVTDSHNVDIRADVYSLGCTLYHLLAGKTPFDAAHPAARPAMHQSDTQPPALEGARPDVPAPVAAVLRKMMAKKREQRHQTPGEAAEELAACLRGGGGVGETATEVLEAQVGPEEWQDEAKEKPPGRRGPRMLLYAGALAVLLAVSVATAVVAFVANGRSGNKQDEVAQKDKAKPVEPRLGDRFTNGIGMQFVRVKAGKFMMGSPEGEKERIQNEGPQHEVEITKDFWLGKYEVTQGQYREVMGYHPSYFSHDGTKAPTGTYANVPAGAKNLVKSFTQKQFDDFPVENVSWQDAQDFLKKLNERAGKQTIRVNYRLPSEAEWEYSCRGGHEIDKLKEQHTLPFHLDKPSSSLHSSQANFDGIYPYPDGAAKGPSVGGTNKVGSYPANVLGLHDMHGNVEEWCEDWYDKDYYANNPPRDPLCLKVSSGRVFRGGCWSRKGQHCRAAYRSWYGPSVRNNRVGFRVVAVPHE